MASETEGLVFVCWRACPRTPDICELRTKFRFRGLGFRVYRGTYRVLGDLLRDILQI